MLSKKHFLILFTILLAVFLLSPIIVFAQEEKSMFNVGEPPKLQMPIPGVPEFSKIQVEGGEISVPWLAQYIAGVYKYGVALAASLTILMIMIGGFLWITAAGDAGKISRAKSLIIDAVIGLILAVGSYVILYTINPDLVAFKALQISLVKREPFGETVEEARGIEEQNTASNVSEETTGGKHDWSYTGFDQIFKNYAGCAGLDYRVLKGIAKKESGLNPEIVNKVGFIGLFQTKGCPTGETNCNLKDPETNLRAVIDDLKKATDYIKSKCPNLPAKEFYILLYLTHNSGLGSLKGAKKGDKTIKGVFDRVGCKGGEDLKNAVKAFWDEWNAVKGSNVNGEGRYNYAVRVANYILSHNVTDPFDQSHGETCIK
jgi:hypothetical protein